MRCRKVEDLAKNATDLGRRNDPRNDWTGFDCGGCHNLAANEKEGDVEMKRHVTMKRCPKCGQLWTSFLLKRHMKECKGKEKVTRKEITR